MSSDVENFVAQVEAAVRHATGRLGAARLRVSSVTVTLQTSLTKTADGSFSVKVIELGGKVDRETTQTVSVEFGLKSVALYSDDLDEDFTKAIETIERAVAESQRTFDLSTAEVTLRLGKTKAGKVQVVLGGSVEAGQVHEATIKLAPYSRTQPS